MYYNLSTEELRSYCRINIESFEMWARRLIHQKMRDVYGEDYINVQKADGQFLIKKELRYHVNQMIDREQGRFSRPVDTLFLDDIIYFLCNQSWYNYLFKDALDYMYPQGCVEAREFLSRLIPIRNALSHSNPISVRQAEQAICYSQDFIEGIKNYYRDKGVEQMWNVPRIIRFSDSLGNSDENPTEKHETKTIKTINNKLYCGDTYSIKIEVDPTFEKDSYEIIWIGNRGKDVDEFKNCEYFSITFDQKDIAENHMIRCKIISNKEWHRHTYYDCEVNWLLNILPMI